MKYVISTTAYINKVKKTLTFFSVKLLGNAPKYPFERTGIYIKYMIEKYIKENLIISRSHPRKIMTFF